jgi:hypothetical protein
MIKIMLTTPTGRAAGFFIAQNGFVHAQRNACSSACCQTLQRWIVGITSRPRRVTHQRKPTPLLDVDQQIEDPCLHGDIERRDGLVADENRRAAAGSSSSPSRLQTSLLAQARSDDDHHTTEIGLIVKGTGIYSSLPMEPSVSRDSTSAVRFFPTAS